MRMMKFELEDSFCESESGKSSKKLSRLDEASALGQSANKSMELAASLIAKHSEIRESKEDIFCKMLCSKFKEFRLAESYDNLTTVMWLLVRRPKAEEGIKLAWQVPGSTGQWAGPFISEASSVQSCVYSSMSSLHENGKYDDPSYPLYDEALVDQNESTLNADPLECCEKID